jgi:hypothetical protein
MSSEQIDELNDVLRDPPITGLALGRSLGCLVAARLAARHGITVRLRASEHGGIAAFIVLPGHLLTAEEAFAPDAAPALDTLAALDAQVPIEPMVPVVPPVELTPPAAVSAAGLPSRLRDALPVAAAFDAGLQSLLDDDGRAELVEPPIAPPPLVAPASDDVPRAALEPEPSGLGSLDPHPALLDDGAPVEVDAPAGPLPRMGVPGPSLHALARRVPGASAGQFASPPQGEQVRRSPDEVRALLSRYRSGLRAGRRGEGPVEGEER